MDSNHSPKDQIYSLAAVSERLLLPKLKLSRGEPIFHFLLDSCSLLTIVHTVTTREPNLIFVLLKFKTFYCSNFRFLYLERELNPHPFRVKEIRSRYAIEAKCMFLNFLLINIQTKYILYPRQELNLTPLVKSQLPTPVCYEGEFGGHRFIIYSWVSTEPVRW